MNRAITIKSIEKGRNCYMKILKAEEMSCNHCVERIHKALDAAEIKHEISLENKTVSIDGCEACAASAVEILDDLGFSAVEIK
jgi:copper chaperone